MAQENRIAAESAEKNADRKKSLRFLCVSSALSAALRFTCESLLYKSLPYESFPNTYDKHSYDKSQSRRERKGSAEDFLRSLWLFGFPEVGRN